MIDAVIARIANNTDDFEPIIWSLRQYQVREICFEHGAAHALTNRTAFRKKFFGKRLIDESQVGGAMQFRIVEDAAGEQRNVEGGEFLWAYERQVRLGARQSGLAAQLDFGVESSEWGKPGGGNCRVRDTRRFGDGLADRLVHVKARLPSDVGSLGKSSIQRKNVVGIQAERCVSEREEGLGCGACGGHKQQCEGNLSRNQETVSVAAASVAGELAAVGLDPLADGGTGKLPCR